MDYSQLGKTIKELRQKAKLTQKELAEGTCTQSQISKIEKGIKLPSSVIMYEICNKLGVDLRYLFSLTENNKVEYIDNVKSVIRDLIRAKEYQKVLEIITFEENNINFKNKYDQQFLMWHKGIAIYYCKKLKSESLAILKKSLEITAKENHIHSKIEIEILNSISVIYGECKEYSESIKFLKKSLRSCEKIRLDDKRIKIRILYNLAKSLAELKQFEEAAIYAEKGIQECLSQQTLYLLGELYYESGWNRMKVNQKDLSIKNFKKSIPIFDIQGMEKYKEVVEKELNYAMNVCDSQ
ncbi:helix-turn-helix domain-containing protein [Bacillus wiedmannii]|uniref:helix-turn-helix domain-containing protein n=1 Tax=Bacillus wiedmannii TaxID=1890302 RepID=UPI000BF5A1AB|nr:helix-turn-helix domain-containing protein [Bacillus wiedmannii]PFY98323.1 transcriptional regulator [Bacillus wiedmannii]